MVQKLLNFGRTKNELCPFKNYNTKQNKKDRRNNFPEVFFLYKKRSKNTRKLFL